MVVTPEIVTLLEAKEFLKVDRSETKFNSVIDMLRIGYSTAIQMWVGRKLLNDTYNEYHDIRYMQTAIQLKQYPVSSIVAATHNGSAMTEDTDYYLYADTGIIKKKPTTEVTSSRTNYNTDYFYEGLRKVSIMYVAGWTAGLFPEDLKLATNKLIYDMFYVRDTGTVKASNLGSLSKSDFDLNHGMPPGVVGILETYKCPFG